MKFDNIEIEEYKFHETKSCISISNIDINKIVVSSKRGLSMFTWTNNID